MSELRFNIITREWVIVLSDRARSPESFRQRKDRKYRPQFIDSCPFCPGNESKTPPELMRYPADGQWKIRVTPNKFATLMQEGDRLRVNDGIKHFVTGVGRHEVIIESEMHDMCLARLSAEEVRDIINVYRMRFADCFNDRRVRHVIIFKNHGVTSGTSIMHPHTQLIGTPVVPIQIRNRVDESMRYFDYTGECLLCATLKDEIEDGRRVVLDSRHFVSFVPYAALSPFHIWVFPKKHIPSFADISDEETDDLAYNLKATLEKVYVGLDDPDFNFAIRSLSPFRGRSEYIHWYMSIVPHVISPTGFELGSGMYVNASLPEEVAEFLRNVKVS
jgi:UDPglucose--hexose-1-phosphate uridylyltransferase